MVAHGNGKAATVTDWMALEEYTQQLRETSPLVAGDSVDVIVSNCVLNLVRPGDRQKLFHEMYRVLRRGGRVVISDIVADEDVPEHLRRLEGKRERVSDLSH